MPSRRPSYFKSIWNKVKTSAAVFGVISVFTGAGYFAGVIITEIKLEKQMSDLTTKHQKELIDEFDKGKTAGQEEFRSRQEDFLKFIELHEKTKGYGK